MQLKKKTLKKCNIMFLVYNYIIMFKNFLVILKYLQIKHLTFVHHYNNQVYLIGLNNNTPHVRVYKNVTKRKRK